MWIWEFMKSGSEQTRDYTEPTRQKKKSLQLGLAILLFYPSGTVVCSDKRGGNSRCAADTLHKASAAPYFGQCRFSSVIGFLLLVLSQRKCVCPPPAAACAIDTRRKSSYTIIYTVLCGIDKLTLHGKTSSRFPRVAAGKHGRLYSRAGHLPLQTKNKSGSESVT